MFNIKKQIENDLSTHYCDNRLYFIGKDFELLYSEITKLIQKDYGFLDINLSFEDFYLLNNLFQNIPKSTNYNRARYMITEQYLGYKILKASEILYKKVPLEKLEESIFSGNYEEFSNMNSVSFILLDYLIKEKSLETKNKQARINFILSDVKDIYLQNKINDLFVYKTGIAMLGFTNTSLCTYYTSEGNIIKDIKDFGGYYSDEKIKKIVKKEMER